MKLHNSSNQLQYLNSSTIEWEGYVILPSWVTIFQLAFQVATALFGLAGNILVCVVVSRRRTMRSSMYFYLRNLAVADIGVLLVNFPLAIIKSNFLWPFGEVFCMYVYPVTDVFFGASIWSITVIAIERRRCISSQSGIRRNSDTQRQPLLKRFLVVILVWSVSLVATAVPVYLVTRYSHEHELCYPEWPDAEKPNLYKQTYMVAMLLFWYVIPLALIIITSAQITRHLNQSSDFHRSMQSEWRRSSCHAQTCRFFQEERRKLKQNNKTKRLLTPIVVLFAISMLPFHLFRLTALYYREFIEWKYYMVMFNIVIVFTISNSALNPLVYCMVSREFRRGFRSVVTGGCDKVRSVSLRERRPRRLVFELNQRDSTQRKDTLEAHTESRLATGIVELIMVSPV